MALSYPAISSIDFHMLRFTNAVPVDFIYFYFALWSQLKSTPPAEKQWIARPSISGRGSLEHTNYFQLEHICHLQIENVLYMERYEEHQASTAA